MRWIWWLLHNNNRRLEVSSGGKWFLAFTIVLGVVAINSGNNVIYLLESLLLSSLIFSGILSELTLSRLDFTRENRQAVAGEKTADLLLLSNRSFLPLYCVELGEWREGKFYSINFVLAINGKTTQRIYSGQKIENRGRHQWDNLAIATSFPFGFARKIRMLAEAGDRIVWPSASQGAARISESALGEWEPAEGEIEAVNAWEDVSRVHWPTSLRTGELMSRPRRRVSESDVVFLKLDSDAEKRELGICVASGRLQGGARSLVLIEGASSHRVDGSWRSLDALALLPKAGVE